jgi:ABC-type phosphate transport system substrate-binding protein
MRFRFPIALMVAALAAGVPGRAAKVDVVVIVSVKSPVTTLEPDQVADIFLGKASRYPDGAKAVPLDQPEGSAARDEFYAQFAGKSAAQVKAHWSKIIFTGRGQPPAEVADSREARKRVTEDPKAIAYVERSLVDDSVRIVTP